MDLMGKQLPLHGVFCSCLRNWLTTGSNDDEEHTVQLIIHPSRVVSGGSNKSLEPFSPAKPQPLWRKREVVRQERTIHYTTVEADGSQQVVTDRLQ
jgi:hypothetical protein